MNLDLVKVKKIVCIYFTPFPYEFYNQASNFENSGIGTALIDAQRDFWVSNYALLFIIYYKDDPNFLYVNIGISMFCIILYTLSLVKALYLIKKI
jgi:hypothetical protein